MTILFYAQLHLHWWELLILHAQVHVLSLAMVKRVILNFCIFETLL